MLVQSGRRSTPLADSAQWVDTALVKALTWAFRWQRILDEGVYWTVAELAKPEASTAVTLVRCCG